MNVVSNTTVLSNFANVGSVELLRRLFPNFFISVEVYQEIQSGFEEGYLFYDEVLRAIHPAAKDGWIQLTSLTGDEEVEHYLAMPTLLHQGEASSIAIAQSRGWLLLTDDRAARKAGRIPPDRLLRTCRRLGQLRRPRSMRTLVHANELLERIIRAGFYSPVADLSALLKHR